MKTKTEPQATARARTILLEPVQQRVDGATKFGPLHYIFPPDGERSSIWDTERLQDEILQKLDRMSYDPDLDFIIVTGHQITVATMLVAIAAEYGKFKVLFFNASDYCYVERALGYV